MWMSFSTITASNQTQFRTTWYVHRSKLPVTNPNLCSVSCWELWACPENISSDFIWWKNIENTSIHIRSQGFQKFILCYSVVCYVQIMSPIGFLCQNWFFWLVGFLWYPSIQKYEGSNFPAILQLSTAVNSCLGVRYAHTVRKWL